VFVVTPVCGGISVKFRHIRNHCNMRSVLQNTLSEPDIYENQTGKGSAAYFTLCMLHYFQMWQKLCLCNMQATSHVAGVK
jgi:hypothetical protein